jgi:hypothetical protein
LRSLFGFAFRDFTSLRLKFFVSVLSVFIAVTSSVFFYALSEGAERATFLKVAQTLSLDELIVRPKYSVTILRVTKEELAHLTDKVLDEIRALPQVEQVFPQLPLRIPSAMEVDLFDSRFESDAPVFGVHDSALEEKYSGKFTYEAYAKQGALPVLISRDLVDLYNTGFADAIGKPKLNEDILIGRKFTLHLGYSSFFRSSSGNPRDVEAEIVGYSDRVPLIGFSIPIGFVEQFNKEFLSLEDQEKIRYSSALVRLKDQKDVAEVSRVLESWDFTTSSLQQRIQGIQQNLNYLLLILGLISVVILFISSLNVFTTIFSIVTEKTKMIGTMRALGATRRMIMVIYLAESFYIGLIGGVLGTGFGVGIALVVNRYLLSALPFFASSGLSLVYIHPGLFIGGVVLSILLCLLSGFYPALRASRLSPQVALQR